VSHRPGKRLRAWTASVAAHGCRGLPVPGICGMRIPKLAGEVAGRQSVSSRPPQQSRPFADTNRIPRSPIPLAASALAPVAIPLTGIHENSVGVRQQPGG